jgi:2,4-dienoyl-CoA reductase (NADPH2)
VVDWQQAEDALATEACDFVEMTRAQIADPDLAAKLSAGQTDRVRPCILCNQQCKVRDPRNPIVSCTVEPFAGHEHDAPPGGTRPSANKGTAKRVTIVGGGPAGLECARVAAERGHAVRLLERAPNLGGMLRVAAKGAARSRLALIVDWLEAECRRLGVQIETEFDGDVASASEGSITVLCTGSARGERAYDVDDGANVIDIVDVLDAIERLPDGPIAIWDPTGGPAGVSLAELLRERATIIVPDAIAANELARTGDLVGANVRLQQAGVTIERRSVLRHVRRGAVIVEHRFSGARRTIDAVALVDAGFRLPAAVYETPNAAGDCVAPRTIHEAILEGRRVALAL